MKSMESADYITEVSEEAQQGAEAGEFMMKDMPLEGTGMDPEAAHERPRPEGDRRYGF